MISLRQEGEGDVVVKFTYKQPEKEIARQKALSHAVTTLTTYRDRSTCVRESYVAEVQGQLLNDGTPHDKHFAAKLGPERIKLWEQFHASCVGKKRSDELSVCYLCGPEPLNDFQVLVDLGVHPHNIWAFESDAMSYEKAVEAVRSSDFPMLKVHRGNIEHFFEMAPHRFDIVYLDACGPLPSSQQKTLRMVSTLLKHHRLESPGALITNFSSPDITNAQQHDQFSRFIASYLYPKTFLEYIHEDGSPGANEGPVCQGWLLDERDTIYEEQDDSDKQTLFLDVVKNNFGHYYGQYITRQLMDLGSVIMPWLRLTRSSYWQRLFEGSPVEVAKLAKAMTKFDEEYGGGDVIVDPGQFPLQWAIGSLMGGLENRDPSPNMEKFVDNWLMQLAGHPMPSGVQPALEAIECYDVLRSDPSLHKKELQQVLNRHFQTLYQFCDVPTRTLVLDLLVNQLAFPMHYVTDAVQRWRYSSKATPMYLDVMIFDECRYIYDWMPSLDLANEGFTDIEQQLSYRFALDGLAKNRRWYNEEYFFGAAVIDQSTTPFEAKYLRIREEL
jgi:hypothetical protein